MYLVYCKQQHTKKLPDTAHLKMKTVPTFRDKKFDLS